MDFDKNINAYGVLPEKCDFCNKEQDGTVYTRCMCGGTFDMCDSCLEKTLNELDAD